MKERPILMSGPNIQPILEGRKTQTRRIVKPQPDLVCEEGKHTKYSWRGGFYALRMYPANSMMLDHCPYGQPGDRLWVRETWACRGKHTDSYSPLEISGNRSHFEIWYAASCIRDGRERFNTDFLGKWRPSIFMPRNLSRILLEITDVRVERLQEITPTDAMAEGVEGKGLNKDIVPDQGWRMAYRDLWKSINGAGSWDTNPFVWVIEFRRMAE